jgi:hypothetical protein
MEPLTTRTRVALRGRPGEGGLAPPAPVPDERVDGEVGEQVLTVLRSLAGGPPPSPDLLARPSAPLLHALEREGLLAHLAHLVHGMLPVSVPAPAPEALPVSAMPPPGAGAMVDVTAADSAWSAPPTASVAHPAVIDEALHRAAQAAARRAAHRNLFGIATLVAASRALTEAGIAHLAFKGPVTNQALYGGQARRVYGDLDLLVRPADRTRATAVLGALAGGSSPPAASPRRPPAVLGQRAHFHTNLPGSVAAGRLPIELHWQLIDRLNLLRIDSEELFTTADSLPFGDRRVPVLAADAQLVYLCCHLVKHGVLLRWGLRTNRPAAWFARAERGFPLAWLLDLHHAWLQAAQRRAAGGADRLPQVVGAWNAAEEVAASLALLDRLLPSPARTAALARLGVSEEPTKTRRGGLDATLFASRAGRAVVAWATRFDADWRWRPIRLLGLPRVLLPSPRRLRAFHRAPHIILPWLYLRHLATMFQRMFAP